MNQEIKVVLEQDGDCWCAKFNDFKNTQESYCGFGKSAFGALCNLQHDLVAAWDVYYDLYTADHTMTEWVHARILLVAKEILTAGGCTARPHIPDIHWERLPPEIENIHIQPNGIAANNQVIFNRTFHDDWAFPNWRNFVGCSFPRL